jgi:hypothetical protein
VDLPNNTNVTVITMPNVPAGSYVFIAKTTVVQTGAVGGALLNEFTRCTLNGDPNSPSADDDYGETELGRGGAWEVGRATLQATVTIVLTTTTSITLQCRRNNTSAGGTPAVARESKIIRIEVGLATRTAVTS